MNSREKRQSSDGTDRTDIRLSTDQYYVFNTVPRERSRSQPFQSSDPSKKQSLLDDTFRNNLNETNGRNSLNEKNARNSLNEETARNSLTTSSRNEKNQFAYLHGSKSAQDKTSIGDGDNNSKGSKVSRHELYKEVMYTCVHMLGTPSPKRFPSTQEEMCLYAHEAFSASPKEQEAVLDHIRNEPFPLNIINTKVRRADGLQGSKPNGLVDPYCIVTIETEDSLGRREWQDFSTVTPLRKSKDLGSYRKNLRPAAENRTMQIYEKVPSFIKTSIQRHKKNPVWDQRFQCLALRPSVDKLTVEVWDHSVDDKYVAKAIRNYSESARISDLDTSLKIVHANENRKKGDVFLGKVSLRVSEIPCDGIDNWYHLTGTPHTKEGEPHGKIRLQIWLVHAYRHGRHFEEIAEPKEILGHLWDWILTTERRKHSEVYGWDGSIPVPATSLLFQYALQNGISEDNHAIIRWNAYAKHDLNLHSVEGRLHELNDVIEKQVKAEADQNSVTEDITAQPPPPPQHIRDSQADIEDNIMDIVKNKILPRIRNHLKENVDDVHEALRSYQECVQVLSKFQESFSLQKIHWLFDAALRMSILEWYQEMHARKVPTHGEVQKSEYVRSVVEVMMEVNALLKLGETKWSPEFWLTAKMEYRSVVYDELQKMVIHDVETVCWLFFEYYHDTKKLRILLLRNEDKDKNVCTAFFDLYSQVQIFVLAQTDVLQDDELGYCCLNEYHRWFRPTLVLWLGFALVKGSNMISKTINIDTHVQDNEHAMTSSSALDTATVFCQLVNFWNALNWPDIAEGYIIIHFLMDVICAFTVLYADLKHAKLDKEGYYDPQGKYTISEKLCTALNNIEFVKEHAQNLAAEINFAHLVELLEEVCGKSRVIISYEDKAKQNREETIRVVDKHIDDILENVGLRVQKEMNLFINESFKGLVEARSNQLHEAVDPIVAYLEDNILILQKSLLSFNFLKVLQLLWNLVCRGLSSTAITFLLSDTADQSVFFKRVLQIIPYLQSYFEGGGVGLAMADMQTPDFDHLHILCTYFTTSTDELIEIYYNSRGYEFMTYDGPANLGTLRVRIGYWNEKLGIQIISASDLTPHDEPIVVLKYFHTMQATSDPFVELELKPTAHFSEEKKHSTNVQWKNLNPVFDESFYWEITADDCLKPAASLVITVKDYDLMSKNAFLGEATIPLHLIPGISNNPEPQPMTLKLTEVVPDHVVLTVLKSRTWEYTAKQFTTDQLLRIVEPIES